MINPTEPKPVTIDAIPELEEMSEDAIDALSARLLWDDKQETHYKLRHGGLKRTAKPWPGAADMNWPMADMMIEKIKPYYIQQAFANELVANFFSLRASDVEFNVAAAQWFDFRLRQRTNFETDLISVCDYMLVNGKGIMKVYWDVDMKTVVYEAVDPVYFIVPEDTVSLKDADWCIQVHHLSEAAYRRNALYNQEILELITTSNSTEQHPNTTAKETEKNFREGLTCGLTASQIVLWEVYKREDDGSITCFVMSPVFLEEYVREPHRLPYDHKQFPYVEFNSEIKDKGFYSSRGIPERVAALQMSMSKLWNEKLDSLTVWNRPIFTADNPLVNGGNIRIVPGEVIPFPIKKVPMDAPPINWDVEINQHRMTAEQMIGIPDAGLSNQFSSNERRTASEVNLLGSVMSQVVDLRSRVFRNALADVFTQSWSLLVQYAKNDLNYFYQNELMKMPPDAMHPDYRIEPLASADNFNKQFVYQKKVTRFQLLQGNPFVNQSNLVRDLIAADDPQDVKTLHMDPAHQSSDHAEDQAGEISRMLIGFPSQVKPVDDDAVHLGIIRGFVERRISQNEEINAELARLLMNHANMHYRQLLQKDKNKAAEIEPQMQQMAQYLGSIVGEAEAANSVLSEGTPAIG